MQCKDFHCSLYDDDIGVCSFSDVCFPESEPERGRVVMIGGHLGDDKPDTGETGTIMEEVRIVSYGV